VDIFLPRAVCARRGVPAFLRRHANVAIRLMWLLAVFAEWRDDGHDDVIARALLTIAKEFGVSPSRYCMSQDDTRRRS
jgi:hypothetical protein